MWFQFWSYLKHRLNSTNQHGVHSPFVYDFTTKCLYDDTRYEEYQKLDDYRAALLSNQQSIEVTDHGAGSRVFKKNRRKVRDIAKHVASGRKENRLLFRLARYFKPKSVIELGTSLGMGTYALALANDKAVVSTVEGCHQTLKVANEFHKMAGLSNIHHSHTTFELFLAEHKGSFDLAFLDGDHRKSQTIKYYEQLKQLSHNESIIIIDDIYWSREMLEAWELIREDSDATVTLDLYYFGMVFFRREQKKQHFKIRL